MCHVCLVYHTQPITATTSRENETPDDQPAKKKQRKSCLFASYKNSLPNTSINYEAQLVKYLNAINEPGFSADDWPNICTSSEFKCLRPLFSRIFSIPASSAPVERIFSQSGLIVKPHRAKMCDNLLETLVYLKCNWVFFSLKQFNFGENKNSPMFFSCICFLVQ